MGTGQQRVTDMVGLANTSLVNSPPSQWEWTANLTIVLTCLETAKPFAESANTHMSHYMMQKDSCMTEFLCRKGKKKPWRGEITSEMAVLTSKKTEFEIKNLKEARNNFSKKYS